MARMQFKEQVMRMFICLLSFAVVGTTSLRGVELDLLRVANNTNSNLTDRRIMSNNRGSVLNMGDVHSLGDPTIVQEETTNSSPEWVVPAIALFAIWLGLKLSEKKNKEKKEKQIVFNSGVTNDSQKYAKVAFLQRF